MTALATTSPAVSNALVLGTPNFQRGGGNQLAVAADSPAASLFNRGVVHTAVALQQVLNAGVQPAALQMAMDHDARERQLLVAVQLEAVRQTHESTERNLDRSARREDSTWYTRLQEDRKLALRKIFSSLSCSLLVSFAIRLSPLLYLVYNAEIVKVRRFVSRLSAEWINLTAFVVCFSCVVVKAAPSLRSGSRECCIKRCRRTCTTPTPALLTLCPAIGPAF
jgi:hypothetical protein